MHPIYDVKLIDDIIAILYIDDIIAILDRWYNSNIAWLLELQEREISTVISSLLEQHWF